VARAIVTLAVELIASEADHLRRRLILEAERDPDVAVTESSVAVDQSLSHEDHDE
jgi:hypothetical protein